MGEAEINKGEESQSDDDIEYGGAEVPSQNDPDSLELRRAADHDHYWCKAPDPLNLHPNRMKCAICGQMVDRNVQSQPWAPQPTFPRAGY